MSDLLWTYTVSVGKETYSRDDSKAYVIPSKRCFVDLSEGHAPPLVRVCDVSLVALSIKWRHELGLMGAYVDTLNIVVGCVANAPKGRHEWQPRQMLSWTVALCNKSILVVSILKLSE